MPTVVASGTQTAVISTEHELATESSNGTFVLIVNTENMVNGDELTLRMYCKVLSGDAQPDAGDTEFLAYEATFVNAQSPKVKPSVPLPSPHQLCVTLQQTAGTGRNFKWSLQRL